MADLSGLGSAVSGSMNSGAGAGGLDSVVGAVDGALTTLDAEAGASAVGQVLRALQGAPGLDAIAGALQQLQLHLQGGAQGGAPDGAAVGALLTTLSQHTREVAGQAGPISGVLHQLAGRLDAVGAKLSGTEGASA